MARTITIEKVASKDVTNLLDVQRILKGRKKIILGHADDRYILQITKNNKLLLTK